MGAIDQPETSRGFAAVRVMNLATVWTVLFKEPGRYNWLLQYYLRAEESHLELGGHRSLSQQSGF